MAGWTGVQGSRSNWWEKCRRYWDPYDGRRRKKQQQQDLLQKLYELVLQEVANPLGTNNTSWYPIFLIPVLVSSIELSRWCQVRVEIAQGRHVVRTCVEVMALSWLALGVWEPNKSPVMAAKKIKCCSPSSDGCGSPTNGCQRKGIQAGESDTALQGIRWQKSPRGKEDGIFIAWDTSSSTDKTLKIASGELTEAAEVVWGCGEAWYVI